MAKDTFTTDEAKIIGDEIAIDWDKIDLEQFRRGLEVEMEHGEHDPETNVTNSDPILTGKIALAHLSSTPFLDKLSLSWGIVNC